MTAQTDQIYMFQSEQTALYWLEYFLLVTNPEEPNKPFMFYLKALSE